jgi:RNA polymerase-binding transcription factor DksA
MNDTTHFEELLQVEKKNLEEELSTVGRRNPSNPADWEARPTDTGQESDPNDAADLLENYQENTAILKDLEIRYNQVLAALTRLGDGTYGTCKIGGEIIEEARLAADPAAATCKAHLDS